jgi:hypothetical protein
MNAAPSQLLVEHLSALDGELVRARALQEPLASSVVTKWFHLDRAAPTLP